MPCRQPVAADAGIENRRLDTGIAADDQKCIGLVDPGDGRIEQIARPRAPPIFAPSWRQSTCWRFRILSNRVFSANIASASHLVAGDGGDRDSGFAFFIFAAIAPKASSQLAACKLAVATPA